MKEQKYIYRVIEKFNNGENPLEALLNAENNKKKLDHIIETDYQYIVIWEE